MVLDNRSLTLNTLPLIVDKNQTNTSIAGEIEQTSGVFQPADASSSTDSLAVQRPASKQHKKSATRLTE